MKSEKPTTIRIDPRRTHQTQLCSNTFPSHNVESYQALIGRHREPTLPFYEFKDLSRTNVVDIELVLEDGSISSVELNQEILNRLGRFIADRPQEDVPIFDCISFAHYVHGIPFTHPYIVATNWIVEEIKTDELNQLRPGDILAMANKIEPSRYRKFYLWMTRRDPNNTDHHYNDIRHFAMYLGNEVFVSKLGQYEPIVFNSLAQLHKTYETSYQLSFEPNQR